MMFGLGATEIERELEEIGEHLSARVLIIMRDGYVMRLIPPRVGLPSVWSVPGFKQGIALDLWIWLDQYLCGRCNVVAFPRCTEEGTSWPCFPCLWRPEIVQSVERGLRWGGAKLDMLLVMWLDGVLLCYQQCCCVTRRNYLMSGVLDFDVLPCQHKPSRLVWYMVESNEDLIYELDLNLWLQRLQWPWLWSKQLKAVTYIIDKCKVH